MSFIPAARRLAGQAGLLLGWRPDEFWRATPDELDAALTAFAGMTDAPGAAVDRATLARLKQLHPDGGADG